jgi:TRAP-type C4-dicarboxylate transport system permease small subunit
MRTAERLLDAIEKALGAIAAIALVVMMLLITIDSSGRYLFNRPLEGTQECVEIYLMIAVVFFGFAGLQAVDGNVSVELLYRRLPAKVQRGLQMLYLALAAIVVALMTWRAFDQAWINFVRDRVVATPFPFTDEPMPVGPSWALATIGLGLLWCRLMLQFVMTLAGIPLRPAEAVHH